MPRYGGRQKGTPNKSSLPAQELADKLGINPLEFLLLVVAGDSKRLGIDERIEFSVRVKAAGEASQYIFPKRKSIDGNIQLALDDERPYKNLTDEELQKLHDDREDRE